MRIEGFEKAQTSIKWWMELKKWGIVAFYGSPLLILHSKNFVIILNLPHTTFTQGLDHITYYPQYPTLKVSPSNLHNVRDFVILKILLPL